MIRFFLLAGLLSLAGVTSAQTTTPASSTASGNTLSSSAASQTPTTEAEAKARDAEYAQWKTRYAANRAWVANEIKEIRSEIATLKQRKPGVDETYSDLLNGSINNWNRDRTDYGDPEQFADCKEVLVNLKTSVRNELTKK
ncbi:hypothetical protein [Spirosoma sp. KUDC1026]|uniref:hypothetical protein n=1 Tax=Spirosoma sp. KUDC1026 TaxID=2745947 RepID=UPI00159BE0AA|nr:hypothetical protein [Spirosoma sp. KUDC1026]QKZ15264.1 hypothetical protein HU175_22615 [Spirosoma sp. KUDC1026]